MAMVDKHSAFLTVESTTPLYDRVSPSMLGEDWDAVRTHGAVAYVLSPTNSHELKRTAIAMVKAQACIGHGSDVP